MDETKAMTLRLARELAEELEAVAQVEDKPIADVVRDAIAGHIEARRADERFQAKLRAALDRNRKILRRLAR